MPTLFRRSIAFIALLSLQTPAFVRAGDDQSAPVFRAGFAERDITPDIGMEQPGGYGKAFHRTLHDPCKVRAAVFHDGEKRVALVGIDALLIRRPSVERCRQAIQEQCGIAPDAVLISASHSHSSGPTGMILPGEFDDAPPFVQTLAYEKSSCADAGYLERVERQIVDAVVAADRGKVDAMFGVGKGVEDKVAFNRRFRMQSGLTVTHPGQGNPDIVDVAGPTDPEVGVLGAWSKDGKLLGAVVNFCCHATTNPGGISANYIYYLERAVRGVLGDEKAVVVFLPGTSGDVTQVDNRSPYAHPAAEAWAQRVGGRVGAEAAKVLLSMPRGNVVPLDYRTRTLHIKRRVPSPARLARSRETVQKDPKSVDPTQWTFAKEIVLLDARLKKEPVADVEVQAIQVGPAVFVANPAEYFCQYGLDIKSGSPFPFTFPVELANDCVGYVPTEEALGPRGGGYETRLTYYSNLEPTAGRQIAEAGIALARELKPGAVPEPSPAPPFKSGPWTYGNVPPELD
jgi:neutral ceramidase